MDDLVIATWGCRHCGDIYEGSYLKELTRDRCPHCGLLQSKSYEEQEKYILDAYKQ